MPSLEQNERIAKLETTSDNHERRIRIQEENSMHLAKLTHFVELQTKHNERQEKQIDNITSIMQSMQSDVQVLKNDMSYVKGNVNDVTQKVDEIEGDRFDNLKSYKDKSVGFYLKLASAVIIAVILTYLGLK